MAKQSRDMTRAQLIQELDERSRKHAEESMLLRHNLDVYREEISAQHSQLQRAHSLLETSRDAYAELFDFAPVAYFSLDPYGVIQSINLTACSFLERERARLIGIPLYGFVTDRDKEKFLDHMRRCRAGEGRIESELTLRTRTGHEVICLVTSRADARPANSYRTILTDISERKRAADSLRELNITLEDHVAARTSELLQANEQLKKEIEQRTAAEAALQELNRRKDDFLAMLGHELRNPLAPLRNAAEILQFSVSGDPFLDEIAEILKRQTAHMTHIVDDLLDVARITRGKVMLQFEVIDLRQIVSDAVHDLQRSVEGKERNVSTELPNQAVWVNGDNTRLTQVVNNLLNNSVKFTDPGGQIVAEVSVAENQSCCCLSVSDTGRGIEQAMLHAVFDTFTQSIDGSDRNRGGLGLGLAVVRGLVELHGGKVNAFSEGLGKGTRVTIELPLAPAPCDPTISAKPYSPNGHHSILLVDDSPDSLRMLKSLLERLGQKVHTAPDAEVGLELARAILPEVIISDIGLPRMDGYAFARVVRRDENLRSVILVALTGYGRPQDLCQAHNAGFDRHITKPVGLDDLEEIVASVANRKEA